MALRATIYKALLNIADMDRQYYAQHQLTLARHPSETEERMLVRLLAFCCYADGALSFTKGLSEVDEPDLWLRDLSGQVILWIDIGQPDETRIRKACGRAQQVIVLAYGQSSGVWWKNLGDKLTRFENLQVWQLPAAQSQQLLGLAARSMDLQCTLQDGQIWLSATNTTVELSLSVLKALG